MAIPRAVIASARESRSAAARWATPWPTSCIAGVLPCGDRLRQAVLAARSSRGTPGSPRVSLSSPDMMRGGLRSCGMRGKDLSLDGGLAWPLPHAERRPVTPRIELPDDQLAVRALDGDRDAWGALIARHDHKVVVALLARGVALAQARELAHQAWIRLIAQQRAGRLDRLELPGLAIRQASFLALDAARRRAAGTADEATADADAVAGPEASI